MKKILAPTDFSKNAEQAFIYALHFARAFNSKIVQLHVAPQSIDLITASSAEKQEKTNTINEMELYRSEWENYRTILEEAGMKHIAVEKKIHTGKVVPGIIQVANEEQADLIIMGTTGASGLKEIFLGSIAGEVMEKAPCPVLAVPQKAKFDGQIDKIAITTEFTEEEELALRRILEFAAIFNAEVHCLNVDMAHTEELVKKMDKLKAKFTGVDRLNFHVLQGRDIREALSTFVQKHGVDLLAMLSHRRNFFQELFHYSMAKEMAYHASTPILAVPAHTLAAK